MTIDKKLVECIAKFDGKGSLTPMRVRFEDNEGQHVIKINKIIESDVKNGFGTMHGNPVRLFSYKCQSIIEGMIVPYKLQFETKGCTWNMITTQLEK